MALEFRSVTFEQLREISLAAPDGAIIGMLGEDGSGQSALLRLAAGEASPETGEVIAGTRRRLIGPGDPLNLAPADVLCLDFAFAEHDALVRRRAAIGLEQLRRAGAVILIASHDTLLLRDLCDEIWWLHEGGLRGKGDPRQVLTQYETHIARRFAEWGATVPGRIAPSMRRGDGRAEVIALETLGEDGRPTIVWQSGAPAAVQVTVRYNEAVEKPVIGIMIRTRIGFEVFGTNTELEGIAVGPCKAAETVRLRFSFTCNLCAQEYTLTAASHDPDGVWHDWLEDAVAFSVADTRYTAGVANLRAQVSLDRL